MADVESVREAAARLAEAQRPVIVAGGGVAASDARAEVVSLAEKLSIPVAVTLNGKDTILEDHALCVGLLGSYGRSSANRLVDEADLAFLIGTSAGGLATGNWRVPRPGTPVIQLDIDAAEIGRNYPATVGLLGDARAVLQQLNAVAKPSQARTSWVQRAHELVDAWRTAEMQHLESDAMPLRPERICQAITDALPADAVVVADTGHAAIWAGTLIGLKRPRQRFIRCAGTLGWAFPAALGVKCALPDQPVLCFTGDGGLCYHLAELETAARAGINIVVLVNNNGSLQQVKRGIDAAYGGTQHGRAHEMWVFNPHVDYARVAEAMGCVGVRVERPSDLAGALERAFQAERPVVIDAISDIKAFPSDPW
jgi:acetolactate synthase-1/2/3 large subunit